MKPRPTIRERLAAYPAAGLLAALLAPLMLVLVSSPAQAAEPTQLCVPSDTAACIVGTLRSEEDTVADVDIVITGPSGEETTVTTDDAGKWNYQATEAGQYQVAIDEESLPDGITARGNDRTHRQRKARRRCAAEVLRGAVRGPHRGVRREHQQERPPHPERVQRAAARAAARARLGRAVPDLRHDRTLQLRARRAGRPRRHPRLRVCQRGRAGPVDRQHHRHHSVRVHRLGAGPGDVAAAAPPRAGHHPDDDRDDRTVPRHAVRLPVLHRRAARCPSSPPASTPSSWARSR